MRSKRNKHDLKAGDLVMLKKDALAIHSKSVPAHCGFTHEQFQWRDTLRKLDGFVGEIERIFEGSDHVNVIYLDGTCIGVDANMLEKI